MEIGGANPRICTQCHPAFSAGKFSVRFLLRGSALCPPDTRPKRRGPLANASGRDCATRTRAPARRTRRERLPVSNPPPPIGRPPSPRVAAASRVTRTRPHLTHRAWATANLDDELRKPLPRDVPLRRRGRPTGFDRLEQAASACCAATDSRSSTSAPNEARTAIAGAEIDSRLVRGVERLYYRQPRSR